MPIRYQAWIERGDLVANRDDLYVFGDNLERVGYGGQAKSMRGEPNAVGLPTKRNPRQYLENHDLEEVIAASKEARERLLRQIAIGGTIIWPQNGIGTGLSKLDKKAPAIFKFYQDFMLALAVRAR